MWWGIRSPGSYDLASVALIANTHHIRMCVLSLSRVRPCGWGWFRMRLFPILLHVALGLLRRPPPGTQARSLFPLERPWHCLERVVKPINATFLSTGVRTNSAGRRRNGNCAYVRPDRGTHCAASFFAGPAHAYIEPAWARASQNINYRRLDHSSAT
jgi:hypothetical protein